MSNPFKTGNWVVYTGSISPWDLTLGKHYLVARVYPAFVRIVDDAGSMGFFPYARFKLAHTLAPLSNCTAQDTKYTLADDEEEEAPPKRVTSEGAFEVGQVLVYQDDTPTNETRTVSRCTATCVWFEETYSMPFNPDEFRRA